MVCWISQWGLRVWLSGHHCHLVTTWSWITVCCQLSGPGVGHVKVKIPIVIHRFCCHTRAWMLCKKNQCTVGKQSGEKPDQSMFSNQSVTFGVVKSDSSVDLKPGAIDSVTISNRFVVRKSVVIPLITWVSVSCSFAALLSQLHEQ